MQNKKEFVLTFDMSKNDTYFHYTSVSSKLWSICAVSELIKLNRLVGCCGMRSYMVYRVEREQFYTMVRHSTRVSYHFYKW